MIDPKAVHATLAKHQLADGFPFVMDLERSQGSWIYDSRANRRYLDFFTCFASWPIGYNHPGTLEESFRREIELAGRNNPANSDLYTTQMADFVEAFATQVTPAEYPYHFWVAGGALAVENALKVAFDWKAHKVGVDQVHDGNDLVILHFKAAFHGRSGYTMSLTNTVKDKVALFPKFDWPRVHNPGIVFDLDGNIANDIEAEEAKACAEIEAAFQKYPGRIAGILIEPMQGEGGDVHFRTEFLAKLRQYADQHEALLLFDEVQTGFFGSGKPWLWQIKGVAPDVVAFGKKTQVCGIYASKRVDEVPDNVFHHSSRINSTWGGNLVDMVRCRKFIEIILAEKLGDNVAARGEELIQGLRGIAREKGNISNVRGVGSLVAFTLDSPETRNAMIKAMRERELLVLPSGPQAIRFRLPLVVSAEEVNQALERTSEALSTLVGA
ncbi:MAG: L-lysine 6-transaminase [Planctomycetes bacterium]|nr:L-lysine 6-transaminase [Planctomycetota bacterium]